MWSARVLYSAFRHLFRMRGVRLGLFSVCECAESPSGSQSTHSLRIGGVTTYLIHRVDEDLSVVTSEIPNDIRYPPVREGCLDKGYEPALGDGTADQASQGSFTRIENKGRPRDGRRGYFMLDKTKSLIENRPWYWSARFVGLGHVHTSRR